MPEECTLTIQDADMKEITEQMYRDMAAYENELDELKDSYREKLKGLFNNIKRVWEWLEDGHDHWKPEGIFDVKIEYKHNGYYGRMMPHATINGISNLHHQKESKREMGVNHIFIRQWSEFEDSYHGYIALPLKNFKYFLISYSC